VNGKVVYYCPLQDCPFRHVEENREWDHDHGRRVERLDQILLDHLTEEHTWQDALRTIQTLNRTVIELEQSLVELKESP
jgi:hypothetical protein